MRLNLISIRIDIQGFGSLLLTKIDEAGDTGRFDERFLGSFPSPFLRSPEKPEQRGCRVLQHLTSVTTAFLSFRNKAQFCGDTTITLIAAFLVIESTSSTVF